MPAIYQPLNGGALLSRLGYANGRFILEDGKCFTSCTQDWAERELRGLREADAEAISEEEIAQVLASARRAGVAASMSVIRERVSHLAVDLPPDQEMDDWAVDLCPKPDCLPFPHGARFRKGDQESLIANTFEGALGLCYEVVGRGMMTPDQAVRLLNQAGELPLDLADIERRMEELPEGQLQERERARVREFIERLGGALIMDRETAEGGRVTAIGIGLSPELVETLTGRFVRDDD